MFFECNQYCISLKLITETELKDNYSEQFKFAYSKFLYFNFAYFK